VKLTLFGLTLSSSWGNGHATPYRALLRALHKQGHHAVFYEKDVDYYSRRRDFHSCEYSDLVLYSDWQNVRQHALANATDSDVVLVGSYCPEGARISDEILELAGPLRVFYDLDTPVTLHQLSAGSLEYLRADQIPEFDLYLSFTGGDILPELEQVWHAKRACPLYACVDPEVHARVPVRSEFRCDLSYMGTHSPDRQHKLEQFFLEPARRLFERRFVLAGSLYPWNGGWPSNVARFDHVAPGNHPALYSSSRATLNITRDGMARRGYCPSGRFFEAAACGTPILSDMWQGLDEFFAPDKEVFVVRHAEDVMERLGCQDDELARVSALARQRTLDQHTGDSRARELIGCFEETQHANDKRKSLEAVS
jgi:spore maturation protein CgeB